ncbi:MAG: class I SAM-dependent methyltransferase [Eubacteriales bacterium]|nr:class I SAM-dependent methyltransferase [Eubacteriales bacterium]
MRNQCEVQIGAKGTEYRSWMSTPVFYVFGGCAAAAAVFGIVSFTVIHIAALGVLFAVVAIALVALLLLMAWIRKQYAFGGGGMMDKVHQTILSYLDYDGKGTLLEVGCGSGPLSIRAALTWPHANVVGVDYWGAMYHYSKELCEKNAKIEGVGSRCVFQKGDANRLGFADETFDAVISNYVYHNIMGADKHDLLLESLRVLKKGGVFVLHDCMKPKMYRDMDGFVKKLRDMGYQDVRLVDTEEMIFGSKKRASLMMLGHSKMLVGRK